MSGVLLVVALTLVAIAIAVQLAVTSGLTIGLWGLVAAATCLALVYGYQRFADLTGAPTELPVFARLTKAGRHLLSAASEQQVAAIVAAEISDILETERAAFVPVRDGRLLIDRGNGSLVVDPGHERGFVRDVAISRETVNVVTNGGLAGRSVALLGVPVIVRSIVAGVLVAVRDPDRSFTLTEQHVLTRVASMVAAALDGAWSNRRVTDASSRDSVTGLANGKQFQSDLDRLGADRRQGTTAIALIDVDGYQRILDRHGNATGAQVLAAVADVLRSQVRGRDAIYRFEADEFCVTLHDIRSDQAVNALDRIRKSVRSIVIPGTERSRDTPVSVSVGVAFVYPSDPSRAVRAARDALAEAKAGGRDRVVLGADSPFERQVDPPGIVRIAPGET